MKIGEMAKLHNLSIHTLRYYDKIGLLKPSSIDEKTGYRYYDEYDCFALDKIKAYRSVGMSINKIKTVLDGSIEDVESTYADIKKDVLDKIQNLNQIASYLDDQLENIKQIRQCENIYDPHVLHLPERVGYRIQVKEEDSMYKRIEKLNKFEKCYNTNAEIFYIPTRLMDINEDKSISLGCYLPLKRECKYSNQSELYKMQTIEEGDFVVINHRIKSRPINEVYDELFKYIDKMGRKHKEYSLEILSVNSNIANDVCKRLVQVQIPLV